MIDELPELAFDHKKIIETALVRLQRSIYFEPIGFQLLDKEFTMPQQQSIYLAILRPAKGEGAGLRDRRNFCEEDAKPGLYRTDRQGGDCQQQQASLALHLRRGGIQERQAQGHETGVLTGSRHDSSLTLMTPPFPNKLSPMVWTERGMESSR